MQTRKKRIPLAWLLVLSLILGGLLPLLHPAIARAAGYATGASVPEMPLCTTRTIDNPAAARRSGIDQEQKQSPHNQNNPMRDCGSMCGTGLLDINAVPSRYQWLGSRPAQFRYAAAASPTVAAPRLYADAQPRAPPAVVRPDYMTTP